MVSVLCFSFLHTPNNERPSDGRGPSISLYCGLPQTNVPFYSWENVFLVLIGQRPNKGASKLEVNNSLISRLSI